MPPNNGLAHLCLLTSADAPSSSSKTGTLPEAAAAQSGVVASPTCCWLRSMTSSGSARIPRTHSRLPLQHAWKRSLGGAAFGLTGVSVRAGPSTAALVSASTLLLAEPGPEGGGVGGDASWVSSELERLERRFRFRLSSGSSKGNPLSDVTVLARRSSELALRLSLLVGE